MGEPDESEQVSDVEAEPRGRRPQALPERIELSLGGRQVFFLFFGSAALACALFASGVLVGKRIAQRSAPSSAVEDPLAALDRLEAEQLDDGLDFHEALARPEPKRAPKLPPKPPAPAPKPTEPVAKPPEAAVKPAAKPDAPQPLPRLPRLPAAPTAH